ncbi:MAG: DUF58 domain-containing protein [Herpetosiphonaceae bacterium]|nr:DUF58 domain-containing protein [Herpetosiphonaceae bacterium]
MRWKTIFRRHPESQATPPPLATPFDEQFLRRLERLALVSSRTLRGGLTGGHASKRRLPAPTVADHRPYTHGDDLRYVDWNVYARHDDLHIKMGEAEQDIGVTILLDGSASMDYGSGPNQKWLVAQQLAAAIGYCTLAQGDHLRVQPFGTTSETPFSASSRQRGSALLAYLAALRPGGQGNVVRTFIDQARSGGNGLIVLISDLWYAQEIDAALKQLPPPRWQIVVLHLLHPQELRPELDGDLELEDSETGLLETLHIDAAARARYDDRLYDWGHGLERACVRRGANYVLLTSAQPLEQAILPFLRARNVLR